jgi:hypothetical protein
MALYVSAGTRRRRSVVAVVVSAVVAFALGLLIGRQQVPSVDEQVSRVRTHAADIATGIERLDIEYEQVLAGDDTAQGGVIEPLDDIRRDLQSSLDDAPWIATAVRTELLDSLAAIESGARAEVPLGDMQALLSDAGAKIRAAFGAG